MPRIIRSAGVNIERARPIVVVPAKAPPKPAEAPQAAPPPPPPAVSEEEKQQEMLKIQSSAEVIVEEILARARCDADAMLVNARAETMRVLQEAVQEGREQGLYEVRREWADLSVAVAAELKAATEAMLNERRQLFRDMERDVLALAFDVAEKVLAIEMNRGDEWVHAMVREALAQMGNDDVAVIKVAAAARTRVEAAAAQLMAEVGKPLSSLNVTADGALPPGGCVIETQRGFVHNGVEEKFDRLKSILNDNA